MPDKKIHASLRPDGLGYMVTYETENSRKVHQYQQPETKEYPPHGAGSYHNPDQHRALLERYEAYLKGQQQ
ncbi:MULTISPECIES: hypothetical protein [unclassified Lentimonas]|uniref:hypothetical protein n=1 Tax=unclassified Lentimonas TaxID=2630993 RepID=UPI0013242081|nr:MULTISPECIES: hypothetical protein [unclassified Lentimonas]CAA6679015.1 Unannotated [Lentimonas sp. CC4]CAA6684244.1 Unannotated [Lentimonas sp. CC6]CAA6693654.1 Unannotated [Lentimonas sp. CC10]CAA6697634.1 Unannotated [Lentimonas sp. CC19]CAA7071713.1 Unannotated [Lentimonas sp. CC11]